MPDVNKQVIEGYLNYTRAVHKETELFLFLIYCFTYNLTLKSLN